MKLDDRFRYPKERPLFVLGAVFSSLVWLLLVISIFGIFYGLLGMAFTLVAHALFLAHIKGNGVRVSGRQFPEMYQSCQKAVKTLGLNQMPDVYLIQADGVLNAFATKLLSRKFVIVHAELADQCHDPRQLEFVIAHEMGHLAAGHLSWSTFLWPSFLLPWLGPAYLRAREYTADRCGLAVVGELEPAMRGLIVLAAGGKHAMAADIKVFLEQRRETGQFWSAVLELVSGHPYLCKRVGALQELRQPGSAPPVPRNILAYPLAPFFGFAAVGSGGGGVSLLIVVAMIGIIAAIAIPSLLRARVSANEAQTLGDVRTMISAQASYQEANAGLYDRLECLVAPAGCIPSYPQNGPRFLEQALVDPATRHGYVFKFKPGPEPPSEVLNQGRSSLSSLTSYAYVAVPVTRNQTGVRSFCGDASGVIFACPDGREPRVAEGSCVPDCPPLR